MLQVEPKNLLHTSGARYDTLDSPDCTYLWFIAYLFENSVSKFIHTHNWFGLQNIVYLAHYSSMPAFTSFKDN